MNRSGYLAVVIAGLAVAGCNPFRQKPAVQVSTSDVHAYARWSGTLTSPAALAGAVQMTGSATMTPGSDSTTTTVRLNLSNASPGGVHPWQLHRGQCGRDEGVFGPASAYQPVTVNADGRASGSATVPLVMPTDGDFYVSVSASAANAEMIVACGNLAPPAR